MKGAPRSSETYHLNRDTFLPYVFSKSRRVNSESNQTLTQIKDNIYELKSYVFGVSSFVQNTLVTTTHFNRTDCDSDTGGRRRGPKGLDDCPEVWTGG